MMHEHNENINRQKLLKILKLKNRITELRKSLKGFKADLMKEKKESAISNTSDLKFSSHRSIKWKKKKD